MKTENKQLLIVFLVGAFLSTMAPSLVNVQMVVIALAVTLVVQRIKKKNEAVKK